MAGMTQQVPMAQTAQAPETTPQAESQRRNLLIFLGAAVLIGAASGINDTIFSNFVNDSFHISAATRGWLEFPRELPGFLVALLSGALFFLAETRMGVLAMLISIVGYLGYAFYAPSFSLMVLWMVMQSIGVHLYLPLGQAIGVSVAEKDQVGRRLGHFSAASTMGTVLACGIVWLGFSHLKLGYRGVFVAAAVLALLGAGALALMNLHKLGGTAKARPKMVFRWEYWRFYLLNTIYGARKQVVLTFGPWVLIKVLNQPATTIATLWMIAALLGVVARVFLGTAIDRLGERRILMGESLLLMLVCLGYSLGPRFGPWGVAAVYVGYVVDQLLVAVTMARTTYLHKIIRSADEMTPTLSLGVTCDHAVAMTIPILGGMAWAKWGYPAVFLGAAGIAVLNILVANGIRLTESPAGKVTAALETPGVGAD